MQHNSTMIGAQHRQRLHAATPVAACRQGVAPWHATSPCQQPPLTCPGAAATQAWCGGAWVAGRMAPGAFGILSFCPKVPFDDKDGILEVGRKPSVLTCCPQAASEVMAQLMVLPRCLRRS